MAAKKKASAKKPILTCKKQVVLKVNYNDLDTFVEAVTGHSLDFVATQECGNDSDHEFVITGNVDKWAREAYEKHCKGDTQCYSARYILDCLCADGHIEAGTYLVSVCW